MASHIPYSMPKEWYDANVRIPAQDERDGFRSRLAAMLNLDPDEPQSVIFYKMELQLELIARKVSKLEGSLELVLGEEVHRFTEWVTCYEAQQQGIEHPFLVRRDAWLNDYREFWGPGGLDLVTLNMETGACVILDHSDFAVSGFIKPDYQLTQEQEEHLDSWRKLSRRRLAY